MSWAKFPGQWVRPRDAGEGDDLGPTVYPLAQLLWSDHKASSIAAIFVLICLAIRLNQANQKRSLNSQARVHNVGVTYEELRQMTGFAKSAIARGLSLLEMNGAISHAKEGRAMSYTLIGLDTPSHWCQLPPASLLKGHELALKNLPRNRVTLNAMKIYLAFLVLRNNKLNSTAMGYDAITTWTGVRREDIPAALGVLASLNLVRVSLDRDYRHSKEGDDDQSNRYRIVGLGWAEPTA